MGNMSWLIAKAVGNHYSFHPKYADAAWRLINYNMLQFNSLR